MNQLFSISLLNESTNNIVFIFIGNNAKLYCRLEVVLCLYYSVFIIRHVAWFTAKFGRNGYVRGVLNVSRRCFRTNAFFRCEWRFLYILYEICMNILSVWTFFSVYLFFGWNFFSKCDFSLRIFRSDKLRIFRPNFIVSQIFQIKFLFKKISWKKISYKLSAAKTQISRKEPDIFNVQIFTSKYTQRIQDIECIQRPSEIPIQ